MRSSQLTSFEQVLSIVKCPLTSGLSTMLLIDPDAIRVANAIMSDFAAIARCEQDLHDLIRRGKAESDDADTFLEALENDLKQIDENIEGIRIEDVIVDAPKMSADHLLHEIKKIELPELTTSGRIKNPLTIRKYLAPLIRRAQLFDFWLEPTVNSDMKPKAAQINFRDAFEADGYVLLEDDSVISPRCRQSWRSDVKRTESTGIFARHLRIVAYIPSRLDSDDPNNLTCPGRPIKVHYKLWNSKALISNPMPKHPVIAIAPLAERGCDVAFVLSECGTKYAVQLNYNETRFEEALRGALDNGAHILLVPEMAVPEGDPEDFNDHFGKLILDVQTEFFDRTQKTGELRLIIAGVVGDERSSGVHENYAVVFDAHGCQPPEFKQHKLSHWNLTKEQQDRFGVSCCKAIRQQPINSIEENSRLAECLTVLDIPIVGRTVIQICSDMSQNNPGDWLGINAVLDWIYAPIMDKSTCWEISDERNEQRPWIVRRTYRSARLMGTLVVTTNSMALTHRVNKTNNRPDSEWPQYAKVGIGLAIDGRRNPPTYSHVAVCVDKKDVLELFSHPEEDWPPFPSKPNRK